MKKNNIIAFFAAVLLCISQTVSAVPAKPGKITVTQPDGTKLTVTVHGDEWFHYVTDESGNIMETDERGFLVKAPEATFETIGEKMGLAKAARSRIIQIQQPQIMKAQATGSPKIPVVLVQFSDKSFSISNPVQAFTSLLNEKGYSANGATGSVLDYYTDQSRGAYTPQFVVLDVVTLSGRMSTYGSTDENAAKALYEACQKLDSSVDFSQFDNDGDGVIDMALMYYAGYNEAEGGPAATIWPHQFYVPYVVTNAQKFDGVTLNRYFCTSELKGASGTYMCGIGTTCHEFAHSLGLPDFYDTNYNQYGDGEAGATYEYDVMCSGSYNNNGCTPPWMNAEELVMLGWMDGISELTSSGQVTIPSISAASPAAYKSSTSVSGEYFLYESRPGTGWDAPLAPGLLVYHVDKSTAHNITWRISSASTRTQTAHQLWADWSTYNAINCNGSHPCFYIVPSGNLSSLNYTGSNFTFPGGSKVTSYTPIEWSGSDTGMSAAGISFDPSDGSSSFRLVNSNQVGVGGFVMDSEGKPIQGVVVSVSAASPSAVSSRTGLQRQPVMMRASGAAIASVTTDATGAYAFDLDNAGTYVLTASKDGYQSKSATLDVSRYESLNIYLLRVGESVSSEVRTYQDDAVWYSMGFGQNPLTIMCADVFPASLLGTYEGKQIKSVSFMIGGESDAEGNTTTSGSVHALIDLGSDRVAFVEVKDPSVKGWNTVDLTDLELIIPAGKDVYAGYALKNWAYQYPIVAAVASAGGSIGYYADYDTASSSWYALSDGTDNYVCQVKLTIGDYAAPEMGYNYIDDPKSGFYRIGDMLALNLVETASDLRPDEGGVSWYCDDEPVSGSVRFSTAGLHTITAEFRTVSGTRKAVELEVTVE